MESSISLEETNKIRISLGLKPLVDDGAPVDVKQKAAEDNYAEERERATAAKRTRFVLICHNLVGVLLSISALTMSPLVNFQTHSEITQRIQK